MKIRISMNVVAWVEKRSREGAIADATTAIECLPEHSYDHVEISVEDIYDVQEVEEESK